MIFGNGGSAAIASHFSVDLTKNAKIRCTNYNESDLLTCFSNDFGYEKWVEKAIEYYGDEGDVLILISSGGNSQNMLNAAFCKERNLVRLLLLREMKKIINFQCLVILILGDSKAYNHIENTHQVLLLSLVDLIIGKQCTLRIKIEIEK